MHFFIIKLKQGGGGWVHIGGERSGGVGLPGGGARGRGGGGGQGGA